MIARFKDLEVGQEFKLSPYDFWWSEKTSQDCAYVVLSSEMYRIKEMHPETEVIPKA